MSLTETASANVRGIMAQQSPQKKISEFAEALGYSAHYGGRKYHGKAEWSLEDLNAAAEWLGVKPAELLRRSNHGAVAA